jgi:hypothetical protein
VLPLFRPMDINAMRNTDFPIDLSSYQDVKDNAEPIYTALADPHTRIRMPCDALWPSDWVALFRLWIDDGMLP